MDTLRAKLSSLLHSRRFWAAAAALAVTTAQECGLPLSDQAAAHVVAILVAWILGDSLRVTSPADPPTTARYPAVRR